MTEKELFNNIKIFANYASKDLGQNYLVNEQICKKICTLIAPSKKLLEVGAGFGNLSFYIIEQKHNEIFLNDIDLRSIKFLSENFLKKDNVKIINKSFLKMDISSFETIIGNLPYYITSHSLEKILIESVNLKQGIFMVQKEFFNRLTGEGKDYGPLFILFDCICEINKEFIVAKTDFLPTPNVDSVVFQIKVKNQRSVQWKKGFYYFLNKMFLHRRKTVFNNLSLYIKNKIQAVSILKSNCINLNLRPENLKTSDFINVFESILKVK